MVVYHNLFREVAGEHLPPSTLRVSALQRLISHRGVADGKMVMTCFSDVKAENIRSKPSSMVNFVFIMLLF